MDMTANLDTDLLKPTEVAARLRVSRSWVYEAAKEGRIPSVRLGGPDGPLRFLLDDVDALARIVHAARGCLASRRRPRRVERLDRRQRLPAQLSIDAIIGSERSVVAPSSISRSPSGNRATSSSSPPSAST